MPLAPRLPLPFRLIFVLVGLLALAACGGPAAKVPAPAASAEFEQMMRVARGTQAAGDTRSAASLYRRAQLLAPARPEPSIALGAIAWDAGEAGASLEAYETALAAAPKDPEALRGAGRAQLALGRVDAAAQSFRAGLAAAPKDARMHNGLAVALDRAGDHEQALRLFAEGLALAPDDLELRGNLGLSHALHGAFDTALPMLEAVAADPRAGERQRANLRLARELQAKAAQPDATAKPNASAP